MIEAPLYLWIATVYGLFGLCLSAVYYFCPRLREAPEFHLVSGLLILVASIVATLGASIQFNTLTAFHLGAQFFLFLGASLCYVPVIVFLVLHYSEAVLERIQMPGLRRQSPRPRPTPADEWARVQAYLESLSADPTNPMLREKLGDLYGQMGFVDSAVYEYRKAAEWLDRGYAQGHVLYKAAYLQVEKKRDVLPALALLRRIIRLYPKSYFAAYSRRVVNHYEAHLGFAEKDPERTEAP